MEEYRAQVHDQLAARKRTTAINHARNQILMQLADAAKGDLPEILVENAYHVEMQSVQQQAANAASEHGQIPGPDPPDPG